MAESDEKKWPLEGIRVVELGSSVAAPYATWILAALGADVIKVERPRTGDDARHWGPPFHDGTASLFLAFNRDKRSVALDLKDGTARAELENMIAGADVVLQNLRPGAAARYRLDGATLTAADPRLVYCNIWAYGAVGPLKDKPGYDPLMQAFGGIMSVTGEGGRPPVRVGTSIVDMGTGMWCAIGILALLQRRVATGHGGIVDASLFETALGWMTYHAANYQAGGSLPRSHGSGIQGIAPYRAYACSDGWLVVAAGNDGLFRKLAAALGHPEWPDDPRFRTNGARVEHSAELNLLLDQAFEKRNRSEWQAVLDEAGVPSAPTQAMDEVLAHPQTAALRILQPLAAGMSLVGLPLSFDGVRPPLRRGAPALGEDGLRWEED